MTTEDPREWTEEDVKAFASEAEPDALEEVFLQLLAEPDEKSVEVIMSFLGASHSNVWLKPSASQMATRALLSLGPPGVDILRRRLLDPHVRTRYRSAVFAAIWEV